ncbi:MAG: hypothetical protein IJU03_03130 [Thermoguttaceae bacterium]|nr:hypothetical protein [Thermoguttaceae bacterium]
MTSILTKSVVANAIAATLTSIFLVATSADLYAADPLDDIRAKFTTIPDAADPCWKDVPDEQILEKLQFLVDQQNNNFKKIKTWNGRYNLTTRTYAFGNPELDETFNVPADEREFTGLFHEVYAFYQDVAKDKLFIARDLVENTLSTFDGKPFKSERYGYGIMTNLKAVFMPKEMLHFERDLNFAMPEGFEEFGSVGQICYIEDPAKWRFSPIGTFFNPKYFFLTDFNAKSSFSHWDLLERILIPAASGSRGEEEKTKTLATLKFQEAEIDGVEWYRVERSASYETLGTLSDVVVLNSAAGYNVVYRGQLTNGQTTGISDALEYVKIDDVYVPSKLLMTFNPGQSQYDSSAEIKTWFCYYELIDARVNQKIPSDQFTIKALELDDHTLINNQLTKTYYVYDKEKGEMIPYSKIGSAERLVPRTPFWRSPARLVFFLIGVALILFGVAVKFKKKSADA